MSRFIVKTTTGKSAGEYSVYEEAATFAENNAQLGYAVFDENDKFIFGKYSEEVLHILAHAKDVADYMREQEWTYGNASKNPFFDKNEKIVSCDRFVGWVLGNAGYTTEQPTEKGLPLYGHVLDGKSGSLETFLIANGFKRIEVLKEVKAGDIMFVGFSHKEILLSEIMREYPAHTFIAAGDYISQDDDVYRYDAGSDKRIQSVQPSLEKMGTPEKDFRFAYRAPSKS